MIQQTKRKEWRKRRRRRNKTRFLLKILILILILCGIGYGGKKLYDIYNTRPSKNNSLEVSNTTNPTDDTEKAKNPEETTESEQGESTDIIDNPDASKEPNSSDKVDGVDKSDESDKSDEVNKPDETDKSDEIDKSDTADKPDGTKETDNQKGNESSGKVDDSYFDDVVFIGDSRTEGFGMYSGLKNTTVYSEKGLMVDTIFKDNAVKINGTKVTIIDALKSQSFGKVYIMLGVNELGWPYDDIFIDHYRKVINAVKESQPDAEIFIQSIIHVSKEVDKKPPTYLNNKLINKRNTLIKKMAEEENVNYLDLNQVLTDSSGYLFTDASTDGIHLNQKYCLVWKDYLLKHTLN